MPVGKLEAPEERAERVVMKNRFSPYKYRPVWQKLRGKLVYNLGPKLYQLPFHSVLSLIQDSIAIAKKTAQCAQYMGALKSFQSPHYAPGYFSRNL